MAAPIRQQPLVSFAGSGRVSLLFQLLAVSSSLAAGGTGGGRAQRLAVLIGEPPANGTGEAEGTAEQVKAEKSNVGEVKDEKSQAGEVKAEKSGDGEVKADGSTAGDAKASETGDDVNHFQELKSRMVDLTNFVSALEQADQEHAHSDKSAVDHSSAEFLKTLEKYFMQAGGPHGAMKEKLDKKFEEMSTNCEKFKSKHPEETVSEEQLKELQQEFGKCVDSVWQFAHLTKQTQRESHKANTEYHNSEQPYVDNLKELEDHDDEKDAAIRVDFAQVNKIFDDGAEQIIGQIKDEFPGMK